MTPAVMFEQAGLRTRSAHVWLLVCVAAVALSALHATQSVLQYLVRDQQPNVARVFALHFLPWLAWIVVLPVIHRAAERWPLAAGSDATGEDAPSDLTRQHWAIHIGIALAAPFAHMAFVLGPIGWLREWWTQGVTVWQGYGMLAINGAVGTFAQYVLVAAACHAYVAAQRARREAVRAAVLSAQLAEAELRALRAQLQPHFLFNTLNAITAHVRDEPHVAEDMLERLSSLLRLMLHGSASQDVTLARELEIVGHYLAIHEVRFGSRLTVAYDIDPQMKQALVPSMLLQPLVENAIVHGAAVNTGAVHVTVAACVAGEWLVITIRNSHVTATALVADSPRGESSVTHGDREAGRGSGAGIGLPNTTARLRQRYGDRFSLRIDSSEQGAMVKMHLPLRLSPAPPAQESAYA